MGMYNVKNQDNDLNAIVANADPSVKFFVVDGELLIREEFINSSQERFSICHNYYFVQKGQNTELRFPKDLDTISTRLPDGWAFVLLKQGESAVAVGAKMITPLPTIPVMVTAYTGFSDGDEIYRE